MIFGYARVSTWGQDLKTQIISLEKAGCERIYSEKYIGTKVERVEFQNLLNEGDT